MPNTTLPNDQGSTEDLLKKMGQSNKDPLEKLGYLNTPEGLNAKRDIKATTDNGTVDVSQLDPNLLESEKINVESAEAVVEQTGEQAQIEPENASELNNDEISETTEPTEEAPASQAYEAPNDKAQTAKKEGDEGSKETEKEKKGENKPEGEESNNPDAAKKEEDKPKDDKSTESSNSTPNNSGEAKPAGPDDSSKKGAQSRAHAEDEAARVEKGKSKLGSAINKVRNADGDDLGEKAKNAAEQEAKQAARRAIAKKLDPAKQAAKQAVRSAGAAIKKAAVSFLANPYVLGAIGVIILIVVIVSVVFSLFAFSSENGGPSVPPSTTDEKLAAFELRSLVGSVSATQQHIDQAVNIQVKRLEAAKKSLGSVLPSDQVTSASSEVDGIIEQVRKIPSIADAKERDAAINTTLDAITAFYSKYGKVVGYSAVRGVALPVPGVLQAAGGDCGAASVMMVIRYYKRDAEDDELFDKVTRASRSTTCVSPVTLNNKTPHKDWERIKYTQSKDMQAVLRSLENGDPVVMYMACGGIYNCSGKGFGGKHIVTVTGYNPQSSTFIINNPSTKSVTSTDRPNGKLLTINHIQTYNGDKEYGHSFIIRNKYLQ